MRDISPANRAIDRAPHADNRRHFTWIASAAMIDRLDEMFRFQSTALQLRSQRQELLAANIANADTPGYKAVDIDFKQALAVATSGDSASGAPGPATLLYRVPTQSSLDGNTVDMDAERSQFAENTVRYEAALRVLNAQIKTMLAALQG
jgi:flagellar basal-body rod protein FlgB